jgi:hypothetical protein
LLDEFDGDLTVNDASDCPAEELPGFKGEVLLGLGMVTVVRTSGLKKDGILMLSARGKGFAYVTVVNETVAISVQLVEEDEDLILGKLAKVKVLLKDVVEVIDIESSLVGLNAIEQLEGVCDVEVLPHRQFSTLLF